jgi:uncharacterized membrane protein
VPIGAQQRRAPTNCHPRLEVVTIAIFEGRRVETMSEVSVQQADQKIDVILGGLLRTGVVLAAAIVFVGGVVYLERHHLPVTNYRVFQGEPAELRTISGIVHEALAFHARGLIQLGLLVLIATPVARVAFSFFAFLYERDWTYVFVTLLVLGLLVYSLLGGHAG